MKPEQTRTYRESATPVVVILLQGDDRYELVIDRFRIVLHAPHGLNVLEVREQGQVLLADWRVGVPKPPEDRAGRVIIALLALLIPLLIYLFTRWNWAR
jgi:hypothetical protein